MASLKQLVKLRSQRMVEDNLETGTVYTYQHTANYSSLPCCFCWKAPGTGTVDIEVWGAGGSGARGCCCGNSGIPGNSGAYTKKTITVQAGCYIYGYLGFSCGNADALCFRGCSEATCVCWFGSGTNGCLCAQGGRGSIWFCSTSTAPYCCFGANGFCSTYTGTGCGWVCNCCPGSYEANAYGGDVNCPSIIGCTGFFGCLPSCVCCFYFSVPVPPGIIARDGALVTYNIENENRHSRWTGQGFYAFSGALNATLRHPERGIPQSYCWRSERFCGCYEMSGCNAYLPIGTGGIPATVCDGERDHGIRGGHGGVRIRFY